MKTYHYCALACDGGRQHYLSGTLTASADLMVAGAYVELCGRIGEMMKPPRAGTDLVLLSLTVIADDTPPAQRPPLDLMRFG